MAHTQASMLAELRRAVDAGRTDVLYVPFFSRDGGLSLAGFEAISACELKGVAYSGPEMTALASREGVAWPLWLATLDKAAAALKAWMNETPDAAKAVLAMKYDLVTPPQSDFAEAVLAALARAGLPEKSLDLEISENVLVSGGEHLAGQLARLRQAGVNLTAGDFGNRFFGFQAAHPGLFGGIKVDPARLSPHAPGDAGRLFGAVASMAEALGMKVHASGAGGEDILEMLKGFSCASLQGDALAKPLTAGQARDMLRRGLDV
jgi:EAL domain-containing protein (putative c-di-GMP-specific phosphodiesterase class I)